MTIAIGNDHAGFELKVALLDHFKNNKEFEIEDCGVFEPNISVDYPDVGHKVASKIETNEADKFYFIWKFPKMYFRLLNA